MKAHAFYGILTIIFCILVWSFVTGCTTRSTTGSDPNECWITADSTVVCGTTEFETW